MISEYLFNAVKQRRCTLLGVGPMSKNCIDAAIELSNESHSKLMLIASRRQIDCKELGGGYVNNWDTSSYAAYVNDKDKRGKVVLARDHGGPWQNDTEKQDQLSLRSAMDSAKASYRADIDSGFQLLHLDPSIDIHAVPSRDEVLDRLFELYEYCWAYAVQSRKEIAFEIGTEEQSGSTNTQEELDYTLSKVSEFCVKNKLPKPVFIVVQTGTRVMEMRNVGSFDAPLRVAGEIPAEIQVPKMVEICNQHEILIKEHNADYLSDEALQWHPKLGIHAANIAPEFGVAETSSFVNLMEQNKLGLLAERFLELSFESKKWHKWMIKDSSATDRDKALIAGHYMFSNPKFQEIKSEATACLEEHGIDLDIELQAAIKRSMYRYMKNFKLIA